MKQLNEYVKHNFSGSVITEYLINDINDTKGLNKYWTVATADCINQFNKEYKLIIFTRTNFNKLSDQLGEYNIRDKNLGYYMYNVYKNDCRAIKPENICIYIERYPNSCNVHSCSTSYVNKMFNKTKATNIEYYENFSLDDILDYLDIKR